MGFNHVKAAKYYLYEDNESPVYENFPVQLAVSTYSITVKQDKTYSNPYSTLYYLNNFLYALDEYTDSGAAGTALATGHKTTNHSIGIDAEGEKVENLTEFFHKLGFATGVITSVPYSHATPAAFVAHNKSRNNYFEIGKEMMDSDVDVIIGAGNPYFDNNGNKMEQPNFDKYFTKEMWNKAKSNYKDRQFIDTKDDFIKYINKNTPKKIFGIPQVAKTFQSDRNDAMKNSPWEVPLNDNVPSLKEVTELGLKALSQNETGFFVMIESGAIDWASHDNHLGRMIEEMKDFNDAIKTAVDWVEQNSNWDETLIVVTADHECGYLTGPKSYDNDINSNPVINNGKDNLPGAKWCSEGHSNSLVPFYAIGGGSNSFFKFANNKDIIYGYYLDNTDIPLTIKAMFE